jgi:hypothetical protein
MSGAVYQLIPVRVKVVVSVCIIFQFIGLIKILSQ